MEEAVLMAVIWVGFILGVASIAAQAERAQHDDGQPRKPKDRKVPSPPRPKHHKERLRTEAQRVSKEDW